MPIELFTPERASILAKQGWEKTRKRQSELLEAEKELKVLKVALASSLPALSINVRVKAIEDEMAEIQANMRGADESVKAKLASAYEKLFKVWCVLTGTKQPGTDKGARRQRMPDAVPLGPGPGHGSGLPLPTGAEVARYWDYDGV